MTLKELESVTNSARFATYESKLMVSFLDSEPKIKMDQMSSSKSQYQNKHYTVYIGNQKKKLDFDGFSKVMIKDSPRVILDLIMRNLDLQTPKLKI